MAQLKRDELLDINDLWRSHDQVDWRNALNGYWAYVKAKNRELEVFMNYQLDSDAVRRCDRRQWYDFLWKKYFPWKYTAPNRLGSTRKHLRTYEERNGLGDLFLIEERLFAFDLPNIQEGLRIAGEIRGLGPPGASGLLAVLFPKWFGTADQFVVKALRQVTSLSERTEVAEMNPDSLRPRDALLLIEIMRGKAAELNALFGADEWTPRKIDMVLWASRE